MTNALFLEWNPNIIGLCDDLAAGQYICSGSESNSSFLALRLFLTSRADHPEADTLCQHQSVALIVTQVVKNEEAREVVLTLTAQMALVGPHPIAPRVLRHRSELRKIAMLLLSAAPMTHAMTCHKDLISPLHNSQRGTRFSDILMGITAPRNSGLVTITVLAFQEALPAPPAPILNRPRPLRAYHIRPRAVSPLLAANMSRLKTAIIASFSRKTTI